MQSVTWDGDKIEEHTGTHIQWRFWSLLVVSNIRICLDFKCFAYHMTLHEVELPLPISASISTYLLITYQGDVSRRRRGELSYHMFWFLWEAKVEHGNNIRMCGGCMQTQVKQKLSDWADAGPASSIQPGEVSCSFHCSCDGHCAPALSVLQPPHVQYNAL